MAKKKKNRSKSNKSAAGAASEAALRTDGPGFGALIPGSAPEKPTKSAAKTATKSGFDATWLILVLVAVGSGVSAVALLGVHVASMSFELNVLLP